MGKRRVKRTWERRGLVEWARKARLPYHRVYRAATEAGVNTIGDVYDEVAVLMVFQNRALPFYKLAHILGADMTLGEVALLEAGVNERNTRTP